MSALARFSGHRVERINLSEQTDIMDLFGAEVIGFLLALFNSDGFRCSCLLKVEKPVNLLGVMVLC